MFMLNIPFTKVEGKGLWLGNNVDGKLAYLLSELRLGR